MKTDPARGEQDEQILRLRCSGLSLRAIGERVGLSHTAVANRIEDAIRELVDPQAEQWRALETARLDDLTRRAYEVLDGAESDEVKLKAVAQLERLSASRRKLWALDMPTPVDVVLSRRLDVEGDVVADAVAAALEVLGLDEERRVLALQAAVARLSGEELPAAMPAPAAVVDEGQAAQAAMEERLRELVADEPDVDVDALLREVDDEGGRDG